MLSGVSLLAVSNVNNPVGLVCLPDVIWSAHFFVTHIQTEKISSWNGPTVHVCCFMLARASTITFVSRVRKTAKKIFVSRKIRYQGHSLAEVSLYCVVGQSWHVLSVSICIASRCWNREKSAEYSGLKFCFVISAKAGPSGRAVYGVGLRPLACRDCGFESHRGVWMSRFL